MAEIYFNTSFGRIEGRYHKNPNPHAPVALILHPHPLHGGTMNNKITYHLFRSFVRAGFTALRINFPGVGKSQGIFSNGANEINAASSAIDWLQHNNPENAHSWIAGFSFGSWVGMHLATRRPEIERFIMVAPPADHYDFSFSFPCPCYGMVVTGQNDTISTLPAVTKLANEWQSQKNFGVDYKIVPDADHFFVHQMDEFDAICDSYINTALAVRVKKPIKKKRRRRKKRDRRFDEVDGGDNYGD